jgi:CBS domain-containing protein
MKVGDIMNVNTARIHVGATLREAAALLASSQASDLMVVDEHSRFLGVLSEGDLIRGALPKFEELLLQGASISAGLELFIEKGKAMAGQGIAEMLIKSPVTVEPGTPVIRAATLMVTKQIRRLPVVEEGNLVGSVSRADICKALMRG